MNFKLFSNRYAYFNSTAIPAILTCVFIFLFSLTSTHSVWSHSYRYNSDTELQAYLATTTGFKLIPSRAGQPVLKARHQQYNRACGIFSIAPIVEYMGYTRYQADSSFERSTNFLRHQTGECENGTCYSSDVLASNTLDVGYFASPEYIAQDIMRMNSYYSRRGYDPGNPQKQVDYLAFLDSVETGSADTRSCRGYYQSDSAQPYAECADSSYDFSTWLNSISNGCSNCTPSATDGMYAYFNRHAIFGCKDAKRFYLGGTMYKLDGVASWDGLEQEDVDQYREVLKSFIDQHIPLEGVIRYGGHFVTIIGYANLDSDGLPVDIIAVNPHLQRNASFSEGGCSGPRPLYWVFRNMNQPQFWISPSASYRPDFHICEDNTNTADQLTVFDNLAGFVSWMQHLELGCEAPEGWAHKLDKKLDLADNAALCSPEADVPEWGQCKSPIYATTVDCYREGNTTPHRQYIVYEDEFDYANRHYEIESRNTTCDDIRVTAGFTEESRRLESATIKRQGWNPDTKNWDTFQSWEQDSNSYIGMSTGLIGRRNVISWHSSWPTNYWLTASGLEETHTMRRSLITLQFQDGYKQEVAIGPKGPQPVPRVFINQQPNDIRLERSDAVTVGVSLDNGGLNDHADYWLAAVTPLGTVFLSPDGWTFEVIPLYQGSLIHADYIEFPAIPLSDFPLGFYEFYFAVDSIMDGDISVDRIYYDNNTMELFR